MNTTTNTTKTEYLIIFNTEERLTLFASGISEVYWIAKTYENSTRIIEDIQRAPTVSHQ